MSESELNYLGNWFRPREYELFRSMPVADQRHGIDVQRALRHMGVVDRDLLCAGLLHDCGKGHYVRLVHRVAWSLGQRYGEWIWRASSHLPTFSRGLRQLRHHAEISARMADEAGCSHRIVELIRHQENPVDADGDALRAADEAN